MLIENLQITKFVTANYI